MCHQQMACGLAVESLFKQRMKWNVFLMLGSFQQPMKFLIYMSMFEVRNKKG